MCCSYCFEDKDKETMQGIQLLGDSLWINAVEVGVMREFRGFCVLRVGSTT